MSWWDDVWNGVSNWVGDATGYNQSQQRNQQYNENNAQQALLRQQGQDLYNQWLTKFQPDQIMQSAQQGAQQQAGQIAGSQARMVAQNAARGGIDESIKAGRTAGLGFGQAAASAQQQAGKGYGDAYTNTYSNLYSPIYQQNLQTSANLQNARSQQMGQLAAGYQTVQMAEVPTNGGQLAQGFFGGLMGAGSGALNGLNSGGTAIQQGSGATKDVAAQAMAAAGADGVDFAQGGKMIVGERGKELILGPDGKADVTAGAPEIRDVPRGSKIVPADQTSAIMGNLAARKNELEGQLKKAFLIYQKGGK